MRRFLFDDEVLSLARCRDLVRESERLQRAEGCGLWAVRLAGSQAVVGFAGFWYFRDPPERELLYGVAATHWGRGIATEAARAMLAHGFGTLALGEVVASTDAANAASIRVMERLGLKFDRRVVTDGIDTVFYRLTKDQWSRRTAADSPNQRLRRVKPVGRTWAGVKSENASEEE